MLENLPAGKCLSDFPPIYCDAGPIKHDKNNYCDIDPLNKNQTVVKLGNKNCHSNIGLQCPAQSTPTIILGSHSDVIKRSYVIGERQSCIGQMFVFCCYSLRRSFVLYHVKKIKTHQNSVWPRLHVIFPNIPTSANTRCFQYGAYCANYQVLVL